MRTKGLAKGHYYPLVQMTLSITPPPLFVTDIMQNPQYFILTHNLLFEVIHIKIPLKQNSLYSISYVISPRLHHLQSYFLTIDMYGQHTHGLYHFLPRWMYLWLQSECGGQWLCFHSWNQAIGLGTLHHKTTSGNPGGRGGSIKNTIINKNKKHKHKQN